MQTKAKGFHTVARIRQSAPQPGVPKIRLCRDDAEKECLEKRQFHLLGDAAATRIEPAAVCLTSHPFPPLEQHSWCLLGNETRDLSIEWTVLE